MIQIGFGLEGYEIDYIRGQGPLLQQENGSFGSMSDSVSVTVGGFIDDEASKQLVVSWTNHQSIVVKVASDGMYAMCKCTNASRYGLPDALDSDNIKNRIGIIQNILGDKRVAWLCGIMVTPLMVLNYINHYYPDAQWTEEKIQNLINSHVLFAQICFAVSGGGTYFNAMIVDIPKNGQSDTIVSIDSQLFLSLATLKNDFDVIASDGSGKSEKVGGENLQALPLGEYFYNYGAIESYDAVELGGFDPSLYYNGEQHFKSVSVSSTKYQQARIRFFVRANDKDTINKILGDKALPPGLIGEPTAYYTEAAQINTGMPLAPFDPSKSTLTGNPAADTCFYQPGQINFQKLINEKGGGWGKAAGAIEEVAKQLNMNTRMFVAQVIQECGWEFASKSWRDYNNPGGVSWRKSASVMDDVFRGVHVRRAPTKRGEGYGYYMVFDSPRDGIFAMMSLISGKYRMGAQSVTALYQNLGDGGYCEKSQNPHYADDLRGLYVSVSKKYGS